MKFNDLIEDKFGEEILTLDENKVAKFFSEHDPEIMTLYGNCPYSVVYHQGEYYCLGEDKTFSSLEKLVKYINEEYNELLDLPINEGLTYAKFKYRSKYPNKGYQIHDKHPKVIVLDNDYCWDGKGNPKPDRHDILAFNLNYSKDKKIDKKAVDEIVSFAHLLRKDKKDVYKRIKDMYPSIIKNIRCYKPQQMTKIKKKDGWLWKQCSVVDLAVTNDF